MWNLETEKIVLRLVSFIQLSFAATAADLKSMFLLGCCNNRLTESLKHDLWTSVVLRFSISYWKLFGKEEYLQRYYFLIFFTGMIGVSLFHFLRNKLGSLACCCEFLLSREKVYSEMEHTRPCSIWRKFSLVFPYTWKVLMVTCLVLIRLVQSVPCCKVLFWMDMLNINWKHFPLPYRGPLVSNLWINTLFSLCYQASNLCFYDNTKYFQPLEM